MIIYKDIITEEELLADTYRFTVVHDCMYRVVGKLTTETNQVDDSMFGGNASAEGGGDDYEADSKSGINVVLAHNLVSTDFDKKSYKMHIKDYMKAVKTALEKDNADAVPAFMKNAAKVLTDFVLPNFGDFEFFIGESMEGMTVLCRWEDLDDGQHPVLYYFKDGLVAEKV